MTSIEQIKADSVEELVGGRARPRLLVESPEEFKGAPKSRRDRTMQLVQRYGKHAT